jgi:hypothetical protein
LARGIVRFIRCRSDDRWRISARKNPAGADFDHDDLHDELQCTGGVVPIDLCRTAPAPHWLDIGDAADFGSESDSEHNVHHGLHQHTARLSDDLRQSLALAMTRRLYERCGASNCRD